VAVDIAAWLKDLDLERYAEAFRDNDIDARVLRTLSADDLKELGVASLGHRKTLLEAIAALPGPGNRTALRAEADHQGTAPREAERRQLTLMFVDLVGSTALAARLDPEDMGRLIRAYHETSAEMVERWGGHVAKYMGDGVLAYFGWPQAHEDAAERAVRAGLAITGAVARMSEPGGEPLAARAGIATGLVMVGELIGEGAAKEQTVVGETPNLAARLQTLAAPGTIVISQATRRLVGGLFELTDLGPRRLKGFAQPLAAWRVEGEGRAEGRFEALHGERLTPLVGREHELGILLERWAWAKDGDGQVVLLSGEPGIGKSRMLRTLRERLGEEPHTPISHYCSPHHTNSALYPVIDLLERAARLERDAPPEEQLARLEAVLSHASGGLDEVVPLLAALLGVPAGDRYPALTMTPEVQKRRTMQSLVDQLAALAAERPVLALYEDVHWIDPTTLELLGMVIERIRQLPVLALITFRPEFQPPWTGQAHVTMLTMGRLGRRQGADLVARVTGDKPLPAAIVEQIVARTDGVPLFVEELTKAVLESGLLRDAGDRYELSGPLPPLAIPATLHDSLMARLDRLAPVKEVAQIGAVIGREFSHELLAAVTDWTKQQLHAALDELVSSELVFRRGTAPDATYSFKHALVQDAAYQSLLKSKRQHLHGAVAAALRERFPELADSQPELLAYHSTEAGLTDQAIEYWHKAGDRAVERSANIEAIKHFTLGLTLLAGLPNSPDRRRREIAMQTAVGAPLLAQKGFAAPEVGEAYSRALELCEQAGETTLLSPVLQGLSSYYIVQAELQLGREMAERCLALAQHYDDPALFLGAHHLLGAILGLMGEASGACDHLHQATALYDPRAHHEIAFRYGADLGVFDRSLCSHFLWQAGYPDQALETAQVALALATEVSHPFSQALALSFAAMLRQFRRETRAARESAVAAITLCDERGFSYYQAWSTLIHGWSLAQDRQIEEGIARMRRGLEAMQATGARLRRPYYLGLLAQAYSKTGNVQEATAHLAEALALVETSSERWWQAELHRLQGEALLTRTGDSQAQACCCFERAVDISRQHKVRSLELRAATSLARLWRDQGRRVQAHDLLAPIYGWFTEGFDTADLKDARALLDELA
jgi:class 3 adenylate cyclase/predicted ATPase